MRRRTLTCIAFALAFLTLASPAFACGGLLSPNGSVNLTKTTTLAAYHKGVEHYVTSFRFVGGGGAKFGSIVPLPGIPSKVERGGDWTLQRLEREVNPPKEIFDTERSAGFAVPASARVILQTRIDALDITVLEGGGSEVATWAERNGFDLPPDAPEVLDFYANRSPIFMAASFDSSAAKKQNLSEGDGTPIHLTIPTPAPWVPLRILALGKQSAELIQADVFLLTDNAPSMLPGPDGFHASDARPIVPGMRLERSERASDRLISDLQADKGMGWMPKDMWLSYITIGASAAELRYDLAIDASGANSPSYVAAGLRSAIRNLADAASADRVAYPLILALALVAAGAIALKARGLVTR
jgi:uncharacterized protein DUF2330